MDGTHYMGSDVTVTDLCCFVLPGYESTYYSDYMRGLVDPSSDLSPCFSSDWHWEIADMVCTKGLNLDYRSVFVEVPVRVGETRSCTCSGKDGSSSVFEEYHKIDRVHVFHCG